ncbi:hypothetical protein CI15_23385 [Paraburkholderia monticola]|uniref:Uncharacterized protein n=1 Tax=Paraburkholderia monticola TaxID=1399968 RepID=A0A149PHA8_9BURK|nr:hypothetical protein CI15_23385 [Paraburkholderia monticola]
MTLAWTGSIRDQIGIVERGEVGLREGGAGFAALQISAPQHAPGGAAWIGHEQHNAKRLKPHVRSY